MDRFIVSYRCRILPLHLDLKSNMDRFIDGKIQQSSSYVYYLKSNMDRFIDGKIQQSSSYVYYLKSNMDRFIDPCNDEILYGGEI